MDKMHVKQKSVENLNELHLKLFETYNHFKIWETFQELKAVNIVGKEIAEENVKIMNQHNAFFILTIKAHQEIFIINLFKFFDTDTDSLSIIKIVNFISSNIKYIEEISKIDIENYKKLLLNYGLDFSKPSNEMIVKESDIWNLKKYRNSLSHNIIKKDSKIKEEKELHFSLNFENLFRVCRGILELSGNLGHHWANYENDEKVKDNTKNIINYLKRFEPYRIQEVNKKYEEEIEKMEK